VKLSTSTLTAAGPRSFVANLVFQHRTRVQRSGDDPRFIVGVDRGRNELAYAALYDRDQDHVHAWTHRSGDEVEHRMDRYAERIAEFQQAGVWGQMEQARKRRFRHKKQLDFEVANAVVGLARGRFDVAIALENLSSMGRLGGYAAESRRFAEWSYGRLRGAIARKADPHDIPVFAVDPAGTSQQCSRCGCSDTRRDGVHFECRACGYQQHADANAAVNIAKRAVAGVESASDTTVSEVTA
jgi:IS605 OrfB family transposase